MKVFLDVGGHKAAAPLVKSLELGVESRPFWRIFKHISLKAAAPLAI